jgi:hypothetical protein
MKKINRANCIADRKYIKENCKLNCKECEFLYEIQTEYDGFSRFMKAIVFILFVCLFVASIYHTFR